MKIYKKILLGYFFLFWINAFTSVFSQNVGFPLIKNYFPRDYQASPQNWEVVQDTRGFLYFANDKGVLEFDSQHWRLIPTSNFSPVRALYVGKDNRIYVGGSNELGYLGANEKNELQYFSLKNKLPKINQDFEEVWSVQGTDEGMFFQTDTFLFFFDFNEKNAPKVWQAPSNNTFFLSFQVYNTLYMHTEKNGLMAFSKGKIFPIPEGETFKGDKIYFIIPFEKDKILIGARRQGLFLYDVKNFTLRKWETQASDFLQKNQLYGGNVLAHQHFAIGTRTGGVVILDKNGIIQEKIDKKTGVADQNIRYIYYAQDHTVWLALNNGIAQINLYSPWRINNENNGLVGIVRSILPLKNKQEEIWVTTSLGIFYHNYLSKNTPQNAFTRFGNIDTEAWTLLKIPNSDDIWAGTNDGIYLLKNGQATLLYASKGKAVLKMQYLKNKIWVGLKGGLLCWENRNGNWQITQDFKWIKDEIYSIQTDFQNNIWLGTFVKGVIKLPNNEENDSTKLKRYGLKQGLPALRDSRLFYFSGKLLIGTPKGLYEWHEEKDIFVKSTFLKENKSELKGVFAFTQKGKDLYMADAHTRQHAIEVWHKQEEDWVKRNRVYKILPEISEPVLHPDFVGGSEGLFALQEEKFLDRKKMQVFLRNVIYNNDSLIYGGYGIAKSYSFAPNSILEFDFITPFFEDTDKLEYAHSLQSQGILAPKSVIWSNWSKDTKISFRNLFEGDYILHIKARNAYGDESIVLDYAFNIQPPIYRTPLALVFYLVLASLMFYALLRIYNARLRQQRNKLQKLVEVRTEEINKSNKILEANAQMLQFQKEDLEQKNVAIEEINRDMTDSINYASRIQKAVLPTHQKLKLAFPDFFLLYKPRDIVSGDFYWYNEIDMQPYFAKDANIKNGNVSVFKGFTKGKKIIAIVDCTGHGVPGAFMSMAGKAHLNQIINLEGITQPALILKELDLVIRQNLRQDETEGTDGMDMAICAIDENNKTIEFAGAKNALIYVQNGELTYIKGDKYSIGGYHVPHEEKNFTRHIISYQDATQIYLFTDGFEDQFGGNLARKKKFLISRMREMFYTYQHLSMEEQGKMYEKILQDWQGTHTQVDDILMMGFLLK